MQTQQKVDPLLKYYPMWIADCEQSIRLLEGKELINGMLFSEWHVTICKLPPLTVEEIVERIKQYLLRIESYKAKLAAK